MESEQTNPALRVHSVLLKAISGPPDTPMLKVWMSAFELDDLDSEYSVLRCILSMRDEIDDIRQRLSVLGEDAIKLHLSEFGKIEVALSPLRLNESRGAVAHRYLSPPMTVMRDLLFCSIELKRLGSGRGGLEHDIAPQMKDLEAGVTALFEAALKLDADSEFKQELLRALESIRAGIATYRIRGVDAIRDGQRMLRGTLDAHSEQEKKSDSREGRIFGAANWFLTQCEKCVKLAKRTAKFAEDVKPIAQDIQDKLKEIGHSDELLIGAADNTGPSASEA